MSDRTVVVVGGGYGGATVATLLDPVADVVLVEPREAFVHNVGALRGLVDPAWAAPLFLPYDRLLRRGSVVRDRVVAVSDDPDYRDDRVGGSPVTVRLGHGRDVRAAFVILATGSRYPFPAKFDDLDTDAALRRLDRARSNLERSSRVVLRGAGPVGVELAGEITSAWPGKPVTIVDPHPELLGGGYTAQLRDELRRQLTDRGVELRLGVTVVDEPGSPPAEPGSFRLRTNAGGPITGDLWFRCHGAAPTSDYLEGTLSDARTGRGHVRVTPGLRVPGHPHVFAIGDVTDVAESKTAKAAGLHAEFVAASIRAALDGGGDGDGGAAEYVPGPPAIVVPLGPDAGASHSPQTGLLGADRTTRLKSSHLKIDDYRRLLGVHEPARAEP